MTTNPLIVRALMNNAELMRKFGCDGLKDSPALMRLYRSNLDTIAHEQAKAAAKRKEVA